MKPYYSHLASTPPSTTTNPNNAAQTTATTPLVLYLIYRLDQNLPLPASPFAMTKLQRRNRGAASRFAKFNNLFDSGVFDAVSITDANGHRIYGSRFTNKINNDCTTNAIYKSQFIALGFGDKNGLLTYVPTVLQVSTRVFLCLAASIPFLQVFLRDIHQACTQSETLLFRPIFLRPPPDLCIPAGHVLRVLRPASRLPESGVYWYCSYHGHNTNRLEMTPTMQNTLLLFTTKA